MAIWISLKVFQSASVLLLLFATSFSTPIVPNWLRDPCHYSNKTEHIRHGRDTKLEEWKKQLRTTFMDLRNISPNIDNLYSKTDGLRNLKPEAPIPTRARKPSWKNYETLRKHVIAIDALYSQQDGLPRVDDFKMDEREKIFENVVHLSKRLLCEVKESLGATDAAKLEKKLVNDYRNIHKKIKLPSNHTQMLIQDKLRLTEFKAFIENWWKFANKKGKQQANKRNKQPRNKKGKQTKIKQDAKKPKRKRI